MYTVKYTLKLPLTEKAYAITFDTHSEALRFQNELSIMPGNFTVQPYIVEGM